MKNNFPYSSERCLKLMQEAQNRILVLDGAMGTKIQECNLKASDFGGELYEGCNENLVLTRPDIILQIHKEYLEAGCDIIETNTFGSTPLVLSEYKLENKAFEINQKAVELARQACDEEYLRSGRLCFVAGSMGPTTKSLSLTGGISFDDLSETYYQQAKGLWGENSLETVSSNNKENQRGVDYFLIETCPDTLNIKAALLGIHRLFEEKQAQLPIAISGTIETMGTLLGGQSIEALLASVMHKDLLYIGLNCASGPEFMTEHLRSLAELSPYPISCVPNAGLPDQDGNYLETPKMMSQILKNFLEEGWVNYIGGCCGTNETHIKAFCELVKNYQPRKVKPKNRSFLSGLEFLEVTDETRPVLIGERTNIIGSKKFKTLIQEQKFEEAVEIARAQVKSGAQIIDVCLSHPDSDEYNDMKAFMEKSMKVVKAPYMIDSTDDKVIELALKYSQGKALINSINFEDGEERFKKIVPLAMNYGAALVVGTIDEDPNSGMATTKERKLEIAERAHRVLVEEYNFNPCDIYFDPLVFPCAVGDEKYLHSAKETIEGLRLIKEKFPLSRSVLGISNVSFGLPPLGREVLNSVFLYHCVQAGLDSAIVNTEKLERYTHLKEEDIRLAENLIFRNSNKSIEEFAAYYQDKKEKNQIPKENLSVDEQLALAIIEGSKNGLIENLDLAMKKAKPLHIINGPLMKGMDEVGRLFNDKKLIVAEVLQSAEVMKAAVSYLEGFMEKSDTSKRGKLLLATVKGDVHDIGKNLVEIIFSNNGFEVIDLGIKVLSETLIKEFRNHQPDLIGLSGLLVKSAQQMVATAQDLHQAGIHAPLLVGGAALTRSFTDNKIAKAYKAPVYHAKDAMNGLDLAKGLVEKKENSKELSLIIQKYEEDKAKSAEAVATVAAAAAAATVATVADSMTVATAASEIRTVNKVQTIPEPPDYDRHILKEVPLQKLWQFINPMMLYGRHLGLKGSAAKKILQLEEFKIQKNTSSINSLLKEIQEEDPKALEILETVENLKQKYAQQLFFKPKAIYRFFKATRLARQIQIYQDNQQVSSFDFERQNKASFLCLSDYVSSDLSEQPKAAHNPSLQDNIALFVVSAGEGVRQESQKLKDSGRYLESHILQALALETAEAFAEYLHSFLRASWQFPDSPQMTMMDRFQAKYRGKRYSFGYPACPRLEDQSQLFKLLQPEDMGVHLTDSYMMDPEASVSALVFHHPEAIYFGV